MNTCFIANIVAKPQKGAFEKERSLLRKDLLKGLGAPSHQCTCSGRPFQYQICSLFHFKHQLRKPLWQHCTFKLEISGISLPVIQPWTFEARLVELTLRQDLTSCCKTSVAAQLPKLPVFCTICHGKLSEVTGKLSEVAGRADSSIVGRTGQSHKTAPSIWKKNEIYV